MTRLLHVVGAQISPVGGDPEATFDKFATEVRTIRGSFPKAQLYLFPELYLAGDQPFVAEAVPLLLAALDADGVQDGHDGVRAVDAAGRAQHLTSVIRRPALAAAITAAGDAGAAAGAAASLDGVAMRRLLEPLRLLDVEVPQAATMDVDTWADAKAVGATGGEGS